MLRRVIHKFRYNSKYIDRNPNRLSTTNRQPIFPKKIPQEISWLNAFLKSFTSRGSSNDRVTIHFENCGLLVKRFTDPIRISITRLGDYNIISIHQMDNIERSVIRYFLHETPRLTYFRENSSSSNLYLHTTRKLRAPIDIEGWATNSSPTNFLEITISRASRSFARYLEFRALIVLAIILLSVAVCTGKIPLA